MIVQGLNALVGFVGAFFSTLLKYLHWVVDGALYVIKAGLYFIYDGLLTTIQAILTMIDYSDFAISSAAAWAGVPSQLIYVLHACGIPAGITLIAGAIGVRLGLNLIPASITRL